MFHVLPTLERKNEKSAIFGRVIHERGKPLDYRVHVIKKGKPKVFVGNEGVYILEDKEVEELIKEVWERYVKTTYGRRKPKSKKDIVEHPVEIKESDVKNFLRKKGFPLILKSCGYILKGNRTEKDIIEELFDIIEKTFQEVKKVKKL